MAKYVIGMDGGGTKTVGVLADGTGKILARATGDSSNLQVIGAEKLSGVLAGLVQELCRLAGLEKGAIDHLCAGLAGAGRPADRETIRGLIESQKLSRHNTVDTDAAAALSGAFAGGPGIIVISGTGSICFGKDGAGEIYRCGGWGFMLGDEGSGYFFGQQGLMAALKDLDGRGPKTRIREALEKRYNLRSIDMIISQIYAGKIDRAEIASNAPIIFDLCQEGDECAKQIIAAAGREIGKLVAATARRMGFSGKRVEVALIGSIFNQRQVLMPFMLEETGKVSDKVQFIDPRFKPEIGSVIIALQKEKVQLNDQVLTALALSE